MTNQSLVTCQHMVFRVDTPKVNNSKEFVFIKLYQDLYLTCEYHDILIQKTIVFVKTKMMAFLEKVRLKHHHLTLITFDIQKFIKFVLRCVIQRFNTEFECNDIEIDKGK